MFYLKELHKISLPWLTLLVKSIFHIFNAAMYILFKCFFKEGIFVDNSDKLCYHKIR